MIKMHNMTSKRQNITTKIHKTTETEIKLQGDKK